MVKRKEEVMDTSETKREAFLRLLATVLLLLTVFLVVFDTQTKLLFNFISRKATFKDLNALIILVCIDGVAVGYNLLQIVKCLMISNWFKGGLKGSCLYQAWICFALDQAAVYIVFAATTAALQASLFAVTGESSFQWMKLCNKYTKFCDQIAAGLVCGYIAALAMAVVSSISAFNLFRLYSPKKFLVLKGQ